MQEAHTVGTLYIVATPIGNLADITIRMKDILASVDLIACEDTRHTRKLLSHLGISTSLTSYYREIEQQKSSLLIEKILKGQNIAVASDAGTPGLSDPGAVLVNKARQHNIPVIPVPGVSALTTALSIAGLVQPDFYFGGFPPAKAGERRKYLASLKSIPCPLFFYESPHRIHKMIADCLAIFGDRQGQLFRELTKLHEDHLVGTLSDLLDYTTKKVRGELVLMIEGIPSHHHEKPENLNDLICWYRDQNTYSLKDAVKNISTDLDLSRSKVYQRALTLWKQ